MDNAQRIAHVFKLVNSNQLISFKKALSHSHKLATIAITFIGGHGFLDGVGVHTPEVGQKICWPPKAAEIFSRQPFHQGVILLNRSVRPKPKLRPKLRPFSAESVRPKLR